MIEEIGCCGAYCGKCKEYLEKRCKGCKLGYNNGARDIERAKCKIKLCCFRDRQYDTCADCPDYSACSTIGDFHSHNGYQYRKLRESCEFIRENGYHAFLEKADLWKGVYGKLK